MSKISFITALKCFSAYTGISRACASPGQTTARCAALGLVTFLYYQQYYLRRDKLLVQGENTSSNSPSTTNKLTFTDKLFFAPVHYSLKLASSLHIRDHNSTIFKVLSMCNWLLPAAGACLAFNYAAHLASMDKMRISLVEAAFTLPISLLASWVELKD